MTRLVFAAALVAALTAGCTSMEPLHRLEPDVSSEVLLAAAESDAPADSACLVLLVELGLEGGKHAPSPETLATAVEALGTRATAGTLPEAQRTLAAAAGEELALDDLRDPAARMTAVDLLAAIGAREAVKRIRDDAADPLVAEHAAEALGGM